MTLDDIRARNPALGFGVYAMEPGGDITLEIYDQGDVFAFTGPTVARVLAAAFPDEPAAPAPPDLSAFG